MFENEIEIINLDSSIESIKVLQPPGEIEMIHLVSDDQQEALELVAGPSGLMVLPNVLRYENLNRPPVSPEDGGVIYSSEDIESN